MLETIFSAFLCIVSAFIFYSSTQFNMAFIGDSGLGPDFFPKVIAIILFILSGMLFIGSLRNKNKKSIHNPNMKYTFMVIFAFAVYIFLIDRIGYLVSTIIFAFIVITILKSKSKILNIIFAIAFPIALYLLFTYAFKVSLPVGLFI
ncbi:MULTISPECIES: tripartite tricarboxylate transporter TctB family protein [Fusobacterium]|uniref:tripartite tricarboxylate transporter TctB family protein n=1 Tax=Fusobacterium TaxID=848 RepID=UPI000E867160|nr:MULTISPECIES: tripartite tricarboxylate transporter TctB family protein [Fusobacterium]HBJ79678.1 tripartite tricarboxylate transporter TctB family protein [Fusobacterium sp.]